MDPHTTLARFHFLTLEAGFIAHGSLFVPRAAERDYERAKSYLCADRDERRLFESIEHMRDRTFTLRINRRNDDHFDPNDDTITWDPYSALRTTTGGRQSPALGLGHEIDHAVESPAREARLSREIDPRYDTREERRVIRGTEARAARRLGEAVRGDHDGRCYRVRSPISRNAAHGVEMPTRANRIANHTDA
jgi:hypothetical protein